MIFTQFDDFEEEIMFYEISFPMSVTNKCSDWKRN